MQRVDITSVEEFDGGWLLDVTVDEHNYQVGVSRDYYHQLTGESESIESLVKRSFSFLLEREPASSIMSRFELSVIQNYFAEYEPTISLGGN